ncbi:MAG: nucleoside triphosphate pyrophosphohydrolase [Verrucomicrobia bacterium]|nr:nucleoside triphosphate pyrophosphohydrolase [Verrucomicrobiota bacterium]
MARKPGYAMKRLVDIVARLRGKGGCPWDREQTLLTLKPYLIEEAYELVDAVDSGDPGKHKEELGDVLLQVILHSQIRREKGEFDLDDVADVLCEKIIRRHPHVFGNTKVSNSGQVLKNWEAIKAEEKKLQRGSLFDGVPRHLPSLQKAQRIQSRAARVGFDWVKVRDVVAKVDEELLETKKAMRSGRKSRIKEELGDLLFVIVNLCRFKKINAEEALEYTIKKFMRRFHAVEKRVNAGGKSVSDCTLDELDSHWNAVKREE